MRLFEQEHASRVALERANEVMTDFVALAAHELRTPVTTIHGFVQTLNHLGDRLGVEQQHELRIALEQQTLRMASLVEQLLDLSRLDADAVEITPQQIDLRGRLEEVVALAAGRPRRPGRARCPERARRADSTRRCSTTSSRTSSRTRFATDSRRSASRPVASATPCR